MSDLLERLEAATEGSRELDAEIAEHLGHKITWSNDLAGDPHPVITYTSGPWRKERGACPRYSTNLDAALSLVPEGWWVYAIYFGKDGQGPCEAIIFPKGKPDCKIGGGYSYSTPALSVCIAALRARENSEA